MTLTEKQLKNKAEILEWVNENSDTVTKSDLIEIVEQFEAIEEACENINDEIDTSDDEEAIAEQIIDGFYELDCVENIEENLVQGKGNITVETFKIGVVVDLNGTQAVMDKHFNIYLEQEDGDLLEFEDCEINALKEAIKEVEED